MAGSRRVVGGGSRRTSTFVSARLDDTSGKDGLSKYRGCRKGPVQQETEAASVVADLLGLEISDLLKQRSTSASVAIERFKAAHCVYSGRLPGGVKSSRLYLTVCQAMSSDDPTLDVASLQGKMGPRKFHLYKAWAEVRPRSLRSRRLCDEDTATRTAVLARILQNSCQELCK